MNCINFSVRSKKYKKYFYCKELKKEINFEDCKNCESKEYKKIQPIKGKKHKRTKETDIPKKVKLTVWNRDQHMCIFCGKLLPWNYANAHFIPRSSGGLGIEENIFTACENCHREQDNGLNSKLYTEKAKKHLRACYGQNWNIKNLIYDKQKTKEGGLYD